MIRQFKKYIPLGLQLLPVGIIAAGFIITAFYYPRLPATMPSGLTVTGQFTNEVTTTWYRANYLALVSVVLYALLTGFSYAFLVRSDDPGRHLGLNKTLRRKISKTYLETYRMSSVRMIFAATTFLTGALVATNLVLLRVSVGHDSGIYGYLPWLFYSGALVSAFRYYLVGREMKKTIRQAAGR